MTPDCGWVASQMDGFLAGVLDATTERAIESHQKVCFSCRTAITREVEDHARIDDLLRAHVRRRMEEVVGRRHMLGVHGPVRRRAAGPFAAIAAAALAAAGIAVWTRLEPPAPPIIAASPPVHESPGPSADAEAAPWLVKADGDADPLLLKIGPPDPADAGSARDFTEVPPSGDADFYVVDAAGYFHRLSDFSGATLVLAVLGDPSGVEAFQQIYDRWAGREGVRFLGVALAPADIPGAASFPLMVNRGSSLLGTPAGGFAIVGPDGEVRMRDRLDREALSRAFDSIIAGE